MRTLGIILIILLTTEILLPCTVEILWDVRGKDVDPLYRFEQKNKAGYIDRRGRVVVQPSLGSAETLEGQFHSGLLRYDSSKGLFIDVQGRIVFSNELFGDAHDFSEGLAPARPKGLKMWGYVNPSGRFVIPPQFASDARDSSNKIGSFSEGLAAIRTDQRVGFIDRSGKFVIKPSFAWADSFSEGCARVIVQGPCGLVKRGACGSYYSIIMPDPLVPALSEPLCSYSFIDKTGREISQERYRDALGFAEGLAAVKVKGVWGYINQSGLIAIPPRFSSASSFSDGLAAVQESGSWGYINRTGAVVIPLTYSYAGNFSEGLTFVSSGDSCVYIGKRGTQVISERFSMAGRFYKGLAHILTLDYERQHFAYIDRTGRHVFDYVK